MTHNVFDQIYEEEELDLIVAEIRQAQTIADRQAFGMPRAENTKEFKRLLEQSKQRIDNLLRRLS